MPITPSSGLDIGYSIGRIRYPVIPRFAYPGSKSRLAPRIATYFPPQGQRYVEPFAGRANVYFAASQLLDYKHFWLNDLQTHEFLRCLKGGDFHGITDDPRLYAEMKKAKADGQKDVELCYDPEGFTGFRSTNTHLLQPYLCFSGGTYEKSGRRGRNRGGVSVTGFNMACSRAYEILHHTKTRITAWDYRKVLEQCGPSDMVYL